jgi:plasmid stability protein
MMASPLKRVNLMLDEGLVERLRREAREHHVSMSEMARALLDRELSRTREPAEILESLRRLRDSFGPMSDSAEIIRKDRDRGW